MDASSSTTKARSEPPTDRDIAAALDRAARAVRRRHRDARSVRVFPVSAATAWEWAEPDGWLYAGGVQAFAPGGTVAYRAEWNAPTGEGRLRRQRQSPQDR
jgi:hypothetical protein